jgi:hypothetical protein
MMRNHRIANLGRAGDRRWFLGAAVVILLLAGASALFLFGGRDSPDKTREVKEEAGPPRPTSSVPGGPRLAQERAFTYADSAYGKCLMRHGVKDFPPLTKPLVLDTSEPTVERAVNACRNLAPASPQPAAS